MWGDVRLHDNLSVHIEFMDTYSTDSFLMAFRWFMCVRGTPSRIQSDRGEQLPAASKQVAGWDFESAVQWAGKKGVEWHLVPTGGQHFNGQAERMIGLIKKQTWQSFEGKKHKARGDGYDLAGGAQIINSRALTRGSWADSKPLSPEDLMLGKAKVGAPAVLFKTGQQLVKRFKTV
jgi:hypothetical protein